MPQEIASFVVLLNVLGIAGIVVWHLQGRSRPYARLIVQIGFFTAMTIVLLLGGIVPFRFDPPHLESMSALFVSAKIFWWVHLSWAVIGFLRIYIVLDGRPREARLIQDLLIAVVYLGVALSVMAFVFGVPIGTLLATSGVIAVILGLALQNTLGDVFSGIALTLGRPYVIGDWILLSDGTEGRIVASNWRSTHLLTAAHNIVVLPNSVLAKLGLTNISRPDENHQITLSIRIVPTRMPHVIRGVMQTVLDSCNSIIKDPPPAVSLVGIDASAVDVELYFQVTSPLKRGVARSEVIDLVYRHCKSSGLQLAMPLSKVITATEVMAQNASASSTGPVQSLIEAIPVFSVLTEEEVTALAASATRRIFSPGDEIAKEGDSLASLMIIRAGIVSMRRDGEEAARLAPGDFFGEGGFLAGIGESHALQAVTRVTVYEIGKEAFAPLLGGRPELAEDLAANLAYREALSGNMGNHAMQHDRRRSYLLQAIRSVFRNHAHG
ncbi:small-conductance mechanosensitive channel/CRP-like cAMP-binding protein [Rhizobium sp. BK512]|uniref:cyclic nucleotide-binding domain-containing protein n=1 Tax=Rhizobium sp. BK512 TaxID=2587010 RepID=UPI000DE00E0A|nr:mechanosensitive ion channel family protein [Rhizobium sp. BK512]MBB3561636.1 small-conductance mechanosensitive channel/CRP-like cAMP-binding protein [Rhizobium sp. BK512]